LKSGAGDCADQIVIGWRDVLIRDEWGGISIVRPSGHDHLGNARFWRWDLRKLGMRFGLIPVADGVEVVGAVVGVTVFDRNFD
jgi:hypothetical protein